MRAVRAIGTGLLTGVAGCGIACLAGDYITQLLHVSNFEGGRGYMVVFLCAPIGILLGLIIGVIASLVIKRAGFVGFLIAEGWALLISCVLAIVITGLVYIGADKPPTIDGKPLTLDFELRIPAAIHLPEPNDHSITASLYTDDKDNRFAELDFNRMEKNNDFVVIPGTIALMTHSSSRSLLASVDPEFAKTQLFNLNLPARPTKENSAWSDWVPATQYVDLKPVPDSQRLQMRYRVRQAGGLTSGE